MKSIPDNINHLWTALIMEELYRLGVKTVCISPGSRSTPLTWAAAEHPELETIVHIDERGLGFHALGIAKTTECPVAIICTSGSAVANLLPAVVEASMSRVPLILLTADRPPELIDCGANQAIKQPGIFGEYVRWEKNLSCPTTDEPLEELLLTVGKAILEASNMNPGPVHINCPFREPLTPENDGIDIAAYTVAVDEWLNGTAPYLEADISYSNVSSDREALTKSFDAARGLLIVGQLQTAQEWIHAEALAAQLNWPMIADIATPFRLSGIPEHLVAYADQLLLTRHRALLEEAECILHVGGALVSKRMQAFIEGQAPKPYVRITPGRLLMDPGHCSTTHIFMQTLDFLDMDSIESSIDAEWRDAILAASETIGCFLAGQFCGMTLSEPEVIRTITQTEASDVFFGNSMPIRDADMFGAPDGCVMKVHANRGASGIDGNIATVAGIAHANGSVTAVIGDLAALHDLNSLALLKANKVVLVIINNAGGGIFSFLPIAEQGKHVEEFFNTPHDCTFESAATMYGLPYVRPESMMDFQTAYDAALATDTSTIIEVTTDRDDNVALHRKLESDLIAFMDAE